MAKKGAQIGSVAEAKNGWIRALALLLDRLQPHPDNQADRERFVLVNGRFMRSGVRRSALASRSVE
jgi:hypothetical protein